MALGFESIDPSKYVTLPIEHEDMWGLYQATLDTFWTSQEINFVRDLKDFYSMSSDQQEFIVNVTTVLFLIHKSVINKEFFIKLINDTEIKEASYFFGSQADTKKTHMQVYTGIMDELCIDKKIPTIESVLSKHRPLIRWALDSLNALKTYNERLLSFAVLQAIVLAGPAAAFEWICSNGDAMPGLSQSNKLITNDTLLHVDFLATLFRHIDDKPDEERIQAVVKDAVDISLDFLTNSEPVSKIGLNNFNMKLYLEHMADRLLEKFGCNKIYKSENPFAFMDSIINAEKRAIEYQSTNFTTNAEEANWTLQENF